MPKWKKDATEFPVSINYNDVRGYQSTIPKPVMETLGNPSQIIFVVDEEKVEVKAGEKSVKQIEEPMVKKKDVFEKVKELAERRKKRK